MKTTKITTFVSFDSAEMLRAAGIELNPVNRDMIMRMYEVLSTSPAGLAAQGLDMCRAEPERLQPANIAIGKAAHATNGKIVCIGKTATFIRK